MPKHLAARPPLDVAEERQVRKLTHSHHAPGDWIEHARMVARSWDGRRTRQIAEELDCHPQTVRDRLHAFNERGLEGLGMKPGSGRKPRLTEAERGAILALVKHPPPGKATDELSGEREAPEPEGEAEWTLDTLTAAARTRGIVVARSQLDTLTAAARTRGIVVARSQVRRIFPQERVRWRRTRLWATSRDPDFAPQGRASSRSTPTHPRMRRSSVSTNSGR
jgi:transposase